MRIKKMIESLDVLVLDRFNSIEEALKIITTRGEIVDILKTEIELMREERRELLNRIMARDFETLQTYTVGGEEKLGDEVKPEEDPDNAGEILSIEG